MFFLHRKPVIPDNGRLTRYELNAYPFEIIIGLQRYGFFLEPAKVFHFFFREPLG